MAWNKAEQIVSESETCQSRSVSPRDGDPSGGWREELVAAGRVALRSPDRLQGRTKSKASWLLPASLTDGPGSHISLDQVWSLSCSIAYTS